MIYIDNGESVESIALKKKLISLLKKYIASSNEVSNSVLSKIKEELTLDELTDIIVNFLKFPIDNKIAYMNEFNEVERAKMLIKDISIELEILSLDHKIDNEINYFCKDKDVIDIRINEIYRTITENSGTNKVLLQYTVIYKEENAE